MGTEAINGLGSAAEEPPRKRTKFLAVEDVSALRKRILEYKLLRLKNLRERFTEHLNELYFLQAAGGNMMDYAAWRKRPPSPQLIAFVEARRPPPVAPPPPEPPPVVAPAPSIAPSADEMLEKAKQEAYVAARVAELSRAGLWPERRLPRVLEPPRPKSHWDYLLEEMAWLAQDFMNERRWKKQAAKRCARAVQKYFQDKALAAQKAEKAQELQLKKIAAFAAKEIRMFWTNVEKLVEWKRERRYERVRKETLDVQLSYIVDRTERYSRLLAANLAAPAPIVAPEPSSNVPDTPPSDDEFQPRDDSDDDEETIAAAEREAENDAADHNDELEALRRESHLDLGDLLPPGYVPAHSPPPSDYGPDPNTDSADDEDTIAEQERSERPEEIAAELAALQDEAELDLDQLVRKYSGTPPPALETSDGSGTAEEDSDDDENNGEDNPATESGSDSETSASEQLEALMETDDINAFVADKDGDAAKGGEAGEQRVEAARTLAASLQPTGTTLSETTVGTPVPRLLRHSLREYQHVGLHWLATMHARRLNGILADEMGLGKTIQTIALLAHLALEHRDWGPHLVVAPTSVVLNWEMEFKKWCPSFKLLTYYGTIKERKLKRVGWTKANSFHVCITSYKLVVQDHQSFRRKRWKYLILDEAQNIKNFKSQRWQMLLNFQTERRLLLTGTPLQNSLLELWSLMHFLMPDVFASHTEFREWFSPVAGIADGSHRYSEELVRRLHEVLRPFLLRRLKVDVERQMPRKYEHVLMCRLSKRQRFLYDDFMSRAKTKESLACGNLLSMINVLMQLRKVCNHPDLFEPRPVSSPLHLSPLTICVPGIVLLTEPAHRVRTSARLGGDLATLELTGAGAFAAHRSRHLAPPRRLVEELPATAVAPPPRPPPAVLRLHLRLVPRAPSAGRALPAPPPRVSSSQVAHSNPETPLPTRTLKRCHERVEAHRRNSLRRLACVNERRCWRLPLFGADLRAAVSAGPPPVPPRDIATVLEELHHIIDRFSICWAACRAGAPRLAAGAAAGAREWRREVGVAERSVSSAGRAVLALFHVPAARQAVAFPHPRLIQYDCGKLQTLDDLLRRLKAGGHRVLIFTQMTRVLDVLEAFLSLHGHAYLRLDGATRVEARQALVDRFNSDTRVFAFILSTRSGGVGLNLTGADAVVFYDSDWNPTMDAQAQDRCHRIGQTRDVHVYRLVTASTVEENILRKADQKRTLGHLAIEDGHFTTSYLRAANIKELFKAESGNGGASSGEAGGDAESEANVEAGGELESALAAAEDEADAAAARAARAEAHRDLAEFDESLPLDEDAPASAFAAVTAAATASATVDAPECPRDPCESSDADDLAVLMKQLTPIEKYAMRMVERSETATSAENVAIGAMRRQIREWEDARRALAEEPPAPALTPAPFEPDLTYCREDARAQVWLNGDDSSERMPMWCPPTPPSGDGDVYCDSWARALYRRGAAPDSLLPPVRWREARAPRSPRRPRPAPRTVPAPPSLFERGGPRPRPRPRPSPAPHRDLAAPPPDWCNAEDAALRRALRLQRLPPEPPAAHSPNWDWLADLINEVARAYRSPRACRDHHDALADPERARRKHRKPPPARRRPDDDAPRPPLQRLDAMRDAAERRRAAPKRRLDDVAHHNPKHAALLADNGVDYDSPPTPMEVATRRAERIAKDKLKAGTSSASGVAATASGAPPPQRIVVAAPGASVGAEAVRRRAGEAAPALLYRQQAMATGRHLKILHHAAPPHSQAGGGSGESTVGVAATGVATVAGAGSAALRSLQLQQLQLRRARPHAPHHVVLAHLAPSLAPASASSTATATATATLTSNLSATGPSPTTSTPDSQQ